MAWKAAPRGMSNRQLTVSKLLEGLKMFSRKKSILSRYVKKVSLKKVKESCLNLTKLHKIETVISIFFRMEMNHLIYPYYLEQ